MITKINEAVTYIQSRYSTKPVAGIVLGSGLGSFTGEIKIEAEITYNDIPHFPVSTVEGHDGKLIFGELGGKKVVAMMGRFHCYEGYTPLQPEDVANTISYVCNTPAHVNITNIVLYPTAQRSAYVWDKKA